MVTVDLGCLPLLENRLVNEGHTVEFTVELSIDLVVKLVAQLS